MFSYIVLATILVCLNLLIAGVIYNTPFLDDRNISNLSRYIICLGVVYGIEIFIYLVALLFKYLGSK